VNLGAGRGAAVREYKMKDGYEAADYLLFVDKGAVGSIEAKKAGSTLTGVEWQSTKYRQGLPDGISALVKPLPFAFESTGIETRFTNGFDPEPASRNVFAFFRPDMLEQWMRARTTLRGRVHDLPELKDRDHVLWPAQAEAIQNLEASLKHGRPRALIQMATGSGKTFTAANICYRLIKYANARRILFLVDRANLGRQTLKEFQMFSTPDDGRKFTELYNVQRLQSSRIDEPSRVVISTIQRLYSTLKGEPLSEELDELSAYDVQPPRPVEVAYTPEVPIETFDVIIVDECHRSIYGLWRQVLEYFDAFIVGLTATPGKQTLGFFDQNLVMEYNHERAVADRVNVDFDVFRISTQITERGSKIEAGLVTEFRDRLTRQKRLELLDQDIDYDEAALDRKVVAKDQIRTIVRAFKESLPTLFPGREHVPKTLIFAKDDSHAEDIVQIVREEFGKGNDFAAKITYKSGSTGQSPETLLQSFRNSYNPRIAVTVDMIATGTDVKPIECVFFMRMVRSRQLFEQMKGRGVRVIDPTDLRGVTPDAPAKERFVIVDAVGVTESDLHDTLPLEREPTVPLDKLLHRIALGYRDEASVSSLAARIARLNLRLSTDDRAELENLAGLPLKHLAENIVNALDPDLHVESARRSTDTEEPSPEAVAAAATRMMDEAVRPIAENPDLRERFVELRRTYEQAIDDTSADRITRAEFSKDATDRARETVQSFEKYLQENRDEITALQILYSRPYKQRLTYAQVKELAHAVERTERRWTPENLWKAYEALDKSKVHGSGPRVLTDILQIVKYALHQDEELIPFPELVNERFDGWLLRQRQRGRKFTPEQMEWLCAIRDQVATSLGVSPDDFQYTPFVERGGLGKAYAVFGDQLGSLLTDLSDVLAA
jgi:type I restriction enzyme R subunit